jgi:hypothetical protein
MAELSVQPKAAAVQEPEVDVATNPLLEVSSFL